MEAKLGAGIINTAELAAFLNIAPEKTTKTLLFGADDRVVAVSVRGEFDVSEDKVKQLVGCRQLKLAAGYVVEELTGAAVGYAGPLGLPADVEVLWDHSTEGRVNFEAGANRTDYHYINLNFGHDLPLPARFVDLRQAREGETCAGCRRGTLSRQRGFRVAEISRGEAPGATVTNKDGKSSPLPAACFALDLLRLLALAAARHQDDRGLVWPAELTPFAAHLISLSGADQRAAQVYEELREAGIEVLWDDRPAAAGVKFGDADLLGIPIRLVVSPKTGSGVEWKARAGGAEEVVSLDDVCVRLLSLVQLSNAGAKAPDRSGGSAVAGHRA
jgi:prolyl-tRNA synthetase